jgi:hypothetical protein
MLSSRPCHQLPTLARLGQQISSRTTPLFSPPSRRAGLACHTRRIEQFPLRNNAMATLAGRDSVLKDTKPKGFPS